MRRRRKRQKKEKGLPYHIVFFSKEYIQVSETNTIIDQTYGERTPQNLNRERRSGDALGIQGEKFFFNIFRVRWYPKGHTHRGRPKTKSLWGPDNLKAEINNIGKS